MSWETPTCHKTNPPLSTVTIFAGARGSFSSLRCQFICGRSKRRDSPRSGFTVTPASSLCHLVLSLRLSWWNSESRWSQPVSNIVTKVLPLIHERWHHRLMRYTYSEAHCELETDYIKENDEKRVSEMLQYFSLSVYMIYIVHFENKAAAD